MAAHDLPAEVDEGPRVDDGSYAAERLLKAVASNDSLAARDDGNRVDDGASAAE